ncbi:RNA polymerase sigma factor [bacterium]|nr:RNA polymerase sigma factor [bacterium]PJA73878.1 MAG: RNA polymerase sigma factor [bacterium CG_4_9_14_3_um_filter_65_15]
MFGLLFSSFSLNKPDPAEVSPLQTEERDGDRRDIKLFLAGQDRGFEDLMNRYRQSAYGIALGLTGNHDDAMDAVQRAFISVHRSLPRFRLAEPFFPWLYRIVRNAALNQRRNEGRHRGDVPLEWVRQGDGRPDPLQQTEAEDLRRRLWEGIGELPPAQREVFLLYHFQGLKYRRIADTLGIPIGTVMSRLHNARLQLRQAMGLESES